MTLRAIFMVPNRLDLPKTTLKMAIIYLFEVQCISQTREIAMYQKLEEIFISTFQNRKKVDFESQFYVNRLDLQKSNL